MLAKSNKLNNVPKYDILIVYSPNSFTLATCIEYEDRTFLADYTNCNLKKHDMTKKVDSLGAL